MSFVGENLFIVFIVNELEFSDVKSL